MRFPLKTMTVATMLFALAGCTNGVSTTATPSATANPLISPVQIPTPSRCLPSQLAIVRGRVGGAMGSVGVTGMGFKNMSTTACSLQGFPKLQMRDATGHVIPTHVLHGTSSTVQARPTKVVVLKRGKVAKFDLGFSASTGYGSAICPTSTQVEITPPNLDQSITLRWQIQPYGGSSIQKLRCGEITVSPVYGD